MDRELRVAALHHIADHMITAPRFIGIEGAVDGIHDPGTTPASAERIHRDIEGIGALAHRIQSRVRHDMVDVHGEHIAAITGGVRHEIGSDYARVEHPVGRGEGAAPGTALRAEFTESEGRGAWTSSHIEAGVHTVHGEQQLRRTAAGKRVSDHMQTWSCGVGIERTDQGVEDAGALPPATRRCGHQIERIQRLADGGGRTDDLRVDHSDGARCRRCLPGALLRYRDTVGGGDRWAG